MAAARDFDRRMLLVLTRRPGSLTQLNGLGFHTVQTCLPETAAITATLEQSPRVTELVVFDYSGPPDRDALQQIVRAFAGGLPLVVLVERPEPRELVELTELGYRFMRTWKCLQRPSIREELISIRDWYHSQRVFREVRSFHELLLQREVLQAGGVLDLLQFGVLCLDTTGVVRAVNHHLELMLGSKLKPFRSRKLSEMRAELGLSPELLAIVPGQVSSGGGAATKLFCLSDTYIERTRAVLAGDQGEELGEVYVFRDISDDVRAGLRDPHTGLLTRDCIASFLARRLDWQQRYSGIPNRSLSLVYLEPDSLELRGASILPLVDRLRVVVREADGLARLGEGLLVLLPGFGTDRSMAVARRLLRRLEADKVNQLGGLRVGITTQSLEVPGFGEPLRPEEWLERHLPQLYQECTQAAYRAGQAGKNRIVHFSQSGGYRLLGD